MNANDLPREYRIYKIVSYVAAGFAIAVVAGLIFGLLIQFLWNQTVADIFGGARIGFWQAVGLFVLAKLFFGFGTPGPSAAGKPNYRRKRPGSKTDVPTDDEAFREYWRERGKSAYETFLADRDRGERREE